ncbi:hypothetical protein KFK09_020312 [Dendrobium nobile]|uniref:Uncharacterized protein n=1 Tax=Dendrobium nobile TaxID=94219 RepID=A0A8T3ASY5_DENNO|nr:hypothetical protein KFK09_020312 [Dendrobium nobile]
MGRSLSRDRARREMGIDMHGWFDGIKEDGKLGLTQLWSRSLLRLGSAGFGCTGGRSRLVQSGVRIVSSCGRSTQWLEQARKRRSEPGGRPELLRV